MPLEMTIYDSEELHSQISSNEFVYSMTSQFWRIITIINMVSNNIWAIITYHEYFFNSYII